MFINREALEVVLESGILYIYTRYGAICHGIVFTINISDYSMNTLVCE